ncbi:MAG: copper amine oxidase [Clostridia bacterium]|nr:copper amine oxidase [Clostridia bacterium]
MKKILSAFLILGLLLSFTPRTLALSLELDGSAQNVNATLYNGTTYVPLRAVSKLMCPDALVSWENNTAYVRTAKLTISVTPWSYYIDANGRKLFLKDGVRLVNGTTMVAVRVLAKALGASVSWNASTQRVSLTSGSGSLISGDEYYDADSLYWLSRIINAESGGESLLGKIAVGNVILNRVASPDFPDSIYDVIFDRTGGVQFTPVANGTIYNKPSEESVLAAKLCLDGASVAGNSLFFLNPTTATSTWITRTRTYVATFGNHKFYA